MRRFELVEGTSSKFWEIALEGTGFTVRFGRIGTAGQTQQKDFPTAEKAKTEHDKLVAEKVKKGYSEVGTVAAPAVAVAPAAEKKKPAKKETAPVAQDERVLEESTQPVAVPIVAPKGPIVATDPSTWPAEFRAELHPSRSWPSAKIELERTAIWKKMRERAEKTKCTASERIAAGRARLESAVPPDALASEEVELAVLRVLAEAPNLYSEVRWVTSGLELVTDHWVATGGLEAAVRLGVHVLRSGLEVTRVWDRTMWDRLASHLANASEDEWARARSAMEELAGGRIENEVPLHAVHAYLFPESGKGDRIVKPAQFGTYGDTYDWLSVAAITEIDSLRELAKEDTAYLLKTGSSWRNASAGPTVYTFVARFGEDVIEPFLGWMERECTDAESTRALARGIGLVSTPRAFEALVSRAADKNVITTLPEAALRTPDAALGALAQGASGRNAVAQSVRAILAQVVRSADISAAEAMLPENLRKVIAEVRGAGGGNREEAGLNELPRVLSQPPWLDKKKRNEAPVLENVAPLAWQDAMVWRRGVREKWRAHQAHPHWAAEWRKHVARFVREADLDALEKGDPAAIDALRKADRGQYFTVYGDPLAAMPFGIARSLVLALSKERFWDAGPAFQKLAAEHELAFLEPLLAYASHHPVEGLPILMPYASARIAPLAANAFLHLKKAKALGQAWLLAHPEASSVGLIPIAVGKKNKERETAEHALRFLAREGHESLVMEVAARHGEPVRAAVRAILDFDARELFPAKMPKLPEFASPTALPRPVLAASGKALPQAAMEPLLLMIAISRPEVPYQGLLDVREVCTPASLAELGWELFQAWLVAGANSKEGWAFTQLGLLGDDECARRLAALVRVWPGEAAHQRAVTGLDVLATIGTDVALMHLHGIAQKLKFKGLQEKAREKIDAIAEARGLSAEELADRLVPDLGLDEQGTMSLDFGSRSFRVGFDEALKPFVRDAEGARLGDLPKPRKDDDAEKAKAATELWKALKKDAKTIATQQVFRLELAMCTRRRWTDDVFRRFLVEHPLVRHLAVRLVWGVYGEGDALGSTFRVAEDGSFADANDDAWELPKGARIGIPHVLELSNEDGERFGQIFGDYEILQPFRQLGRETYALIEDEKKAIVIARWKERVIPTGSVLGLEARGWRRGEAQDGGVIHWFERKVNASGEEILVTLDFEPGIIAGAATEWKEQKLHGIGIGVDWQWQKQAAGTKFGELHPIVASELIRDIELLVSGSAG
jgi:predicted DNA-binding WGR domain protein